MSFEQNIIDEADLILNAFSQEWGQIIVPGDRIEAGPAIDGREAIQWMKNNNIFGWRYNEWPPYFIMGILKEILPSNLQYRKERSFIYFEGEHPWDIRIRSITSSSRWVSLGHTNKVDEFIAGKNGYGLIIAQIHSNLDYSGEFREWHINLKGGPSEYIQKRESEGARRWYEKTAFFVIDIHAFYFPDLPSFKSGLSEGWLRTWATGMRNSNDNPRTPKYQIDLSNPRLENRFHIRSIPLNVDLEEMDDVDLD